MPLELQPSLLRVLEDGRSPPWARTGRARWTFRLVAASNRDLRAEVAAGRFRMDLFYRVSVTSLVIPALRERQEDIPALVEHFSRDVARRHGMSVQRFEPEVLSAFANYAWPGNVRELRNVVEGLVLMTAGETSRSQTCRRSSPFDRRGEADPRGSGTHHRHGPRRGGARRHHGGDPDVPRQSHPGRTRPPHCQEHAVPQNPEIRAAPRPSDRQAERPIGRCGRWSWPGICIIRNGAAARMIVRAQAMTLRPSAVGPGPVIAGCSTLLARKAWRTPAREDWTGPHLTETARPDFGDDQPSVRFSDAAGGVRRRLTARSPVKTNTWVRWSHR